MNVIEDTVVHNEVIKNSKFICILINKKDLNIVDQLNIIKNEYKGATHYTYAYIINGLEKAYDDGEPKGTAGLPILNILKHNNINNVLAVVIRYFGGVKLGAGGLIRAYSKVTNETVKNSILIPYIEKDLMKISFNHNDIKQVEYLLRDITIIEKEFKEKIIFTLEVPSEDVNNLLKILEKYIIKQDD